MARITIACGLTITLALLCIGTQGFKCYQCNTGITGEEDCKEAPSKYDNACFGSGKILSENGTIKTDGDDKALNIKYACRKTVQGETVKRLCLIILGLDNIEEGCTTAGDMETCDCKKESCNGAGDLTGSPKIVAIAFTILTAFFVAKY